MPDAESCLRHLNELDLATYLATLGPGSPVNHRGTSFTPELLARLLSALRDPVTRQLSLGAADFSDAEFAGESVFEDAFFTGKAWFDRARFLGGADFSGAQFATNCRFISTSFVSETAFAHCRFQGEARFSQANFNHDALYVDSEFSHEALFDDAHFNKEVWFERVKFTSAARFDRAVFTGAAWIEHAEFEAGASFNEAKFGRTVALNHSHFHEITSFTNVQFEGAARFYGVRFSADVSFRKAQFSEATELGPILCLGQLSLAAAHFVRPVAIEVAARQVRCFRTRWDGTALLRIRYATVDLTDALVSNPLAVNSHPAPFDAGSQPMTEAPLAPGRAAARIAAVSGVDAAHLVLTDTDLSECQFTGAFHLDQIRLEGTTTFAPVPQGLQRRRYPWPDRWSQRRTLAEEHYWRAQYASQPAPLQGQDPTALWRPGPHHGDQALTPDPDDVAAAYRQLRKAFEDGKNEPGAADFYYGEMEMRRHDRTSTPRSERSLLHAYWLLSGYGLRASRAFTWLLLAMLTTLLLLMGFGLPQHSPAQEATGTVPAGGGRTTFTIDKDAPQNPTGNRLTSERFDKALTATLNSVIFRSSGQDLTTAGTYIEMTSRLLEPALLALAVLAIRGRIKR